MSDCSRELDRMASVVRQRAIQESQARERFRAAMHLTGAQQGSACERLKRALQHSAPMSEPSPAAEGTSERANVGRPAEQDAEAQMNVPPGAQTYAQRTLGKESGPTAGLQCAADVTQCAAAAPETTRKQSGDSRIARLEREMQELQERNAQLDAAAQKAREEADELYTSAKLLAEDASAKQQHLEARLRSAQEALQLTQQAYKDERQRREEEEAIIEHSLGTVFQRSNQLQHDAMRCGWSSDGSPERLKRLAGIDYQEFDLGTREAGVGQGTTQTMDGLAAGWVEREPGLVERNPVPGERSAFRDDRRCVHCAPSSMDRANGSRDWEEQAPRVIQDMLEEDEPMVVREARAVLEAAHAAQASRASKLMRQERDRHEAEQQLRLQAENRVRFEVEQRTMAETEKRVRREMQSQLDFESARAHRACDALHQLLRNAGLSEKPKQAWHDSAPSTDAHVAPLQTSSELPVAKSLEWIERAENRLMAWIDNQHEINAKMALRVEQAGVASQEAIESLAREAEARIRADERSRRMVGAVRLASREVSGVAYEQPGSLERARGGFRPDRTGQLDAAPRESRRSPGLWRERALAAETHNERVGKLLTNYVIRNQLMLPHASAGLFGAQASYATRTTSASQCGDRRQRHAYG